MINEKCLAYGSQGSAIRELYEFGKKRKAVVGEDKVYDYSLGNPSIPTPKEFNDTLIDLIETQGEGIHGYTSAPGDLETRNVIAKRLNEKYGAQVSGADLYLVCGAAAGLAATLKAVTTSPEDEIIVIAPFFPEYSIWIEASGAKQIISKANEKMLPDLDDLQKRINKNTTAIIIDSPNNPTGVVYGEAVIQGLAALLESKEKEYRHPIYLISDEPYRELVYSDKAYPFITNHYDDSIVIYSYSKSLSLPGERIGYVLVNPKAKDSSSVLAAIRGAGRLLGYVNAPALFQFAILRSGDLTSDIAQYKINRDALCGMLKGIGYEYIEPEGAFYLFMKALEPDAKAFSEKAKQYDLLLVPSDSFGLEGYVRLAYCVSLKTIRNSEEAFKRLYQAYRK